MKNLTLTIFTFLTFQFNLLAQMNSGSVPQLPLVMHIYSIGKPNMDYVQAEKKVAIKWGFTIDYLNAGCDADKYDHKKKEEFEKKNEAVYKYLENKYGKDWRTKFDAEVEAFAKANK